MALQLNSSQVRNSLLSEVQELIFRTEYGFELKQDDSAFRIYRTHDRRFIIKAIVSTKEVIVIPLKSAFLKTEEKYKLHDLDLNEAFFNNWFFLHDKLSFRLINEEAVINFLRGIDLF